MPINVAVGAMIAFMSALELWLIHYAPAPGDGTGPAVTSEQASEHPWTNDPGT
jgi:hypothetical protein